MNIIDVVFVAEFREPFRDVIPKIVKHGSWKPDVGANVLAKLSKQGKVSFFVAEFRESIMPISDIINHLWHRDLNIRRVGADALLKLSEESNMSSFLF